MMQRIRRLAPIVLVALAAVAAPKSADAQWGGYGFGGYGGYGGYGAFGGAIGTTIYDQDLIKQQSYALSASRYDLQNAQTVNAYQSANLMQQQAYAVALENQKRYDALQEKYDLKAREAKAQAEVRRRQAVLASLNNVIDSTGQVLWPAVAPDGGDFAAVRQAAEDAIRYVYREYKAKSKAGVSAVVDASKKLHEYGEPALTSLRYRNQRKAATDLRNFLNQLDESISDMGAPPPKS
jgi:hypothetical protein